MKNKNSRFVLSFGHSMTLLGLYIFDLCWKLMSVVFQLDSCHAVGSSRNWRMCDENLVPFWLSLGIPLVIDLVVLIILFVGMVAYLTRHPNPNFQTNVVRTGIIVYAIWILVSDVIIWQLPFFSAPLYPGPG